MQVSCSLATQRKEHVHVSVIGDLLAQFAGQASTIFQSAPSRIKNRLPHLKSREINIIKKDTSSPRLAERLFPTGRARDDFLPQRPRAAKVYGRLHAMSQVRVERM